MTNNKNSQTTNPNSDQKQEIQKETEQNISKKVVTCKMCG